MPTTAATIEEFAKSSQISSRILVPVDFSCGALLTMSRLASISELNESRICLLHIIETPSFSARLCTHPLCKPEKRLIREAQRDLKRLAEKGMPRPTAVFRTVRSGRVGPEIVRAARELSCDLIVMSVDNRSASERARHFLFGTTADWVARHAPCPVLTLWLPKDTHSRLCRAIGKERQHSFAAELAQSA